MRISSQTLKDALNAKLTEEARSALLRELHNAPSSEVIEAARLAGIQITGDGNVVGNNNINVVVKADLAEALRAAFDRNRKLFQLPAPLGDFVGRLDEIDHLRNSLRHDASPISAVNGMGGVGKTELAFYVAHQLREEYSDGHLLLNMRGTEDTPRDPKDALVECVRSLIGGERKLPDSLDELANLYRSLLSGRKVLLVLDNAADGTQISPLRPPQGCGMLITCRSPIALPGITNISLGELGPSEARELLLHIAGEVESSVADLICRLCGYLPLAIRAVSSLLAVTADLDPSEFANRLRDERTRLEQLGTEGVNIGVRASFNLSYEHCSVESAAVFRQLAAFPASFDSKAAEFVCSDEDHQRLSDLLRRSLVLFDKDTSRYRLHELMRIFGKSLTDRQESAASELLFARHYLSVLSQANRLYLQTGVPHSNGLEMFDAEWENIRKGWTWSSEEADNDDNAAKICWSYSSDGSNILLDRLSAEELETWCQRSISIAKHLNNREAELNPRTLLGLVYASVGEYNSAEESFRKALHVAEEVDDPRAAAVIYEHLGRALEERGILYDAIESLERAKQIWCDLDEHEREGKLVSEIGLAYSSLRETSRAIQHLRLVLENSRRDGRALDEANALANLGNVYSKRNRQEAISLSEEAAQIFEKLNYKHWAAQTLSASGLWLVESGESVRGIERIQQAITVLSELKDQRLEVLAMGTLGEAYMFLNKPREAITSFDRQCEIAREIGDRHREANALGDKGIMLLRLNELELAMAAFDEARRVAQLTGNLSHEFNTLCKIGEAYAKAGKRDEAINAFEDQARLGKSTGVVSKELHALKHIADLFAEWGDIERATDYMRTRITVSTTSKDAHDHPESTLELAEFLSGSGRYDEAIEQAENAASLFQLSNDFSCARKALDKIDLWKTGRVESPCSS